MAEPLTSSDPRQLGAYWLAGRLGSGGQGVVYEGYDDAGARVAVKALHAEYVTDAYRDQLRREVAALSLVAPFCTARIISADLIHNPPYLVSEYVAGPDLQSRVDKDGPYKPQALLRLAIGIATALSSIHQAGVIHRDLKPANVLIGPDGPRVIDFGIARTEEMSRSATGQLKGTPRWMAPELFRGERATPAVDIWAWGAIVLFAGTGTPPFHGDNLPRLVYQVLNHRPALDRLPPQLQPLVAQALSQDPAARPTAPALLASLIGLPANAVNASAALEAGQRAADHDGTRVDGTRPALGDAAEKVFGRLPAGQQALVPRILLRMIAAFPDAQHTLRKVSYPEFHDGELDEPTLPKILDVLCDGGLVTRDDTTFTLATPALIRAWPRLRAWVDGDRSSLNAHHELADAARNWSDHGRKNADLLQGSRLDRAIDWAVTGPRHLTLNVLERAYLDASVAASRRRRRARTLVGAALAVLLVVATTTAGVAVAQGNTLADRNATVTRQLEASEASRIANLATTMRLLDPVAAKRLAIAAGSLSPHGMETRSALMTLHSQWEKENYQPPGVDGSWRWGMDTTGRLAVYARTPEVKVVDVDARKVVSTFTIDGGDADCVSVSGDGRYAALTQTAQPAGSIARVWDLAAGKPVGASHDVSCGELTATGKYLYGAVAGGTNVWETASGRRVMTFADSDRLAATPDETSIYVWPFKRAALELWDLGTGKMVMTMRMGIKGKDIGWSVASPDGRRLAFVHRVGRVTKLGIVTMETKGIRWRDLPRSTGRIIPSFSSDASYVQAKGAVFEAEDGDWGPVLRYPSDDCWHDRRFGPGGKTLRCIDTEGKINVISVDTVLYKDRKTTESDAYDTAASADGSTFVAGGSDSLEVWHSIGRTRRATLPIPYTARDNLYALDADGRHLANCRKNGEIEVWDTASATKKLALNTRRKWNSNDEAPTVAVSPDGRTLAALYESRYGGPSELQL
ncbi:protein kinase domain-containing protein [Microtetraspora malaysiensis]|uniref:protein kinase domain-containing protein n=1 Tax=Microtetraspora malaysiensis TaxID=161358 RepID=UPI003D8AB125